MATKKPGAVYLPLDVEFMDNDKVAEAGEAAGWLYLAMSLRSKRLLTDGRLTRRQIERLPVKNPWKRMPALLDVGLVAEESDGRFWITGWTDRNKLSSELVAAAEAKAAGAALGNHLRWHVKEDRYDPRCAHCTDPEQHPSTVSTPIALPIASEEPSESTKTEAKTEAKTETKTETVLTDSLPVPVDHPAGKPAKPTRAHRLPEDFAVTADMVAWAHEAAPAVDGRHETEQWRDYHLHKGDVGKDWRRSWQTWMRRAQKDAENRRPGLALVRPAPLRASTRDAAVAQTQALADQLRAAEQSALPLASGDHK